MNKLVFCRYIWLFAALVFSSCYEVEDTTNYYFKALEGQEDKLPTSISQNARSFEFEVAFDTGQEWTATIEGENTDWLKLSANEGSAGINKIFLKAEENNLGKAREAELYIMAKTMGKRIKVIQRPHTQRTVLLYMAAENSLASFAMDDVMELVQGSASIPNEDNMLVYIDDTKLPRIYQIDPEKRDTVRVKTFDTDLDSASPETVKLVLNYVYQNYNSEEGYGLVMWSHGEGFIPGTSSAVTRYIGIDNGKNSPSANTGSSLDVRDLATSITQSDIKHLQFLFFDACFMQTIEVIYQLKDCADYIVGSPCEIPGPGAPYSVMTKPFFSHPLDVKDISFEYYNYYDVNEVVASGSRYGAVLSAVDCSKVDAFTKLTRNLITQYFNYGKELPNIPNLIRYGFGSYGDGSRYSLYSDFGQVIKNVVGSDSPEYNQWKAAYDEMVISRDATSWWYTASHGTQLLDRSNYTGVAACVPGICTESITLDDFRVTDWYAAAGWDAAGW
ncbi:MAG: clostripain-related cysteine peptidase [Bacteroidales bacterium]|nr:clostripain-related cysteine peptidase [Bacteroidales bacterium]